MTLMDKVRRGRQVPAMGPKALLASAFVVSALTSLEVRAQQAPPPRWDVSAGVGVASTSIYPGSGERFFAPFPSFEASYTNGMFSASASVLDGLGFTYFQPSPGLLWNLAIRPGPRRTRDGYSVLGIHVDHPEHVRSFLQSSSDASTPASAVAMLGVPTSVGLFGVAAGYHPTEVTSAEPGGPQELSHGAQYSLVYALGLPVADRLSVSGTLQVTYMNDGYAEAWYGVELSTPSLPVFEARRGLQDTQLALEMEYRFNRRTKLSFLGASTWLLGDARRSPFTQSSHAHDFVLQLLYRL